MKKVGVVPDLVLISRLGVIAAMSPTSTTPSVASSDVSNPITEVGTVAPWPGVAVPMTTISSTEGSVSLESTVSSATAGSSGAIGLLGHVSRGTLQIWALFDVDRLRGLARAPWRDPPCNPTRGGGALWS